MRQNASRPSLALTDLLPEYYRERPQVMEPLLDFAEALLAETRLQLSENASRWSDSALLEATQRWFPLRAGYAGCSESPRGTKSGARVWFRKRFGVEPRFWTGFSVVVRAHNALYVVRERQPSVVVVVEPTADSAAVDACSDLPDFIPVRTQLQVVSLSSEEQSTPPYHQRRVVGALLWDSAGRST